MPRGIAYRHLYHVLIPQSPCDCGVPCDCAEEWQSFKIEALRVCRARAISRPDRVTSRYASELTGRDIGVFGEADRYYLAIDESGDCPAFVLVPKWYEDYRRGYPEVRQRRIDAEARRVFNRFIRHYADVNGVSSILYWTTWLTARAYTVQEGYR